MSSLDKAENAIQMKQYNFETDKPKSLWAEAFSRLLKDKTAVISLSIVSFYILVAILSALGIIGADWAKEVGPSYASPSWAHPFGTDIFGRSVFQKVIKGTEVAVSIGFITAFMAIIIGGVLGSLAGYFGGKIDEVVVWFFTVFSSIPFIILIVSIAFVLGKGILAVYLSLGLTTWVGICRLVRAEVIRHKNREYVHAAQAIGGGHMRRLFIHIIPNVTHILIINFSLQFQTAIKAEVILSYLGLGVQGSPSWGKMIDDAKLELAREVWWQLAGAVIAMFFLVWSLNILGDALRDALDPKLRGKD